MNVSVKIRVPDSWSGRVHSAEVRGWMQSWFQNPGAVDPGAGDSRIRLATAIARLKDSGELALPALQRSAG